MSRRNGSDPLPPLEWLRVFEAAGRLGNFTAAADELGLTQAAVSQRIRHLETRLNTHLFVRLARGVELTADGEAYLPHIRNALDAVRRSTADLFGTPRTRITIAAPASVAALWIAPRLRALGLARPTLQVLVSAIHRSSDFDATQADFEVRFGQGSWPERAATKLYTEVLAPACSPDLLRESDSREWRRLPTIAVSGPRDGWNEWAAATGELPLAEPVLRFDSMITALNAAGAGAGVLLASLPLARVELTEGGLVKLSDKHLTMADGYWLTWPAKHSWRADDDAIVSGLCE
jgi:LysR family glycine cleavage system transcriptional activator